MTVSVIGQFKRGKSALNSILGYDILPVGMKVPDRRSDDGGLRRRRKRPYTSATEESSR